MLFKLYKVSDTVHCMNINESHSHSHLDIVYL